MTVAFAVLSFIVSAVSLYCSVVALRLSWHVQRIVEELRSHQP
jgi:hypothetical protein